MTNNRTLSGEWGNYRRIEAVAHWAHTTLGMSWHAKPLVQSLDRRGFSRKRLSHALATVKAQQDKQHEPKIQTNSEKIGYQKNPRQLYGEKYRPKSAPPPAVEITYQKELY